MDELCVTLGPFESETVTKPDSPDIRCDKVPVSITTTLSSMTYEEEVTQLSPGQSHPQRRPDKGKDTHALTLARTHAGRLIQDTTAYCRGGI